MRKIMIIGSGGSGKSTLSEKLHRITHIPLIHLDQLFWSPNWVEPKRMDWIEKVERTSDQDQWIMDGNYGGTMSIRLQKADMIIFLNRSRWLCIYRILKRVISNYGATRPDMAEGCKEKFSWHFLKYVYHYNDTRRPGILEKLNDLPPDKEVFILSSNREVKRFLEEMRRRYAPAP